MAHTKLKEFFEEYEIVFFMVLITFGWVILYTFYIILSMIFFSL